MIASYILHGFKRQKWVVFSWGFNSPTSIENGLKFKVNGFIHKGFVEVVYKEGIDLFEVKLIKNNNVVDHILNVYIEDLVETLDNHIEKVENYEERVKKEYSM